MTTTLTRPETRGLVTLADPPPGTSVELAVGDRLCVRFRRGVGDSQWHLVAHPGHPAHLVPLAGVGHELHLIVFPGPTGPASVRFERRHAGSGRVTASCEVRVEVA